MRIGVILTVLSFCLLISGIEASAREYGSKDRSYWTQQKQGIGEFLCVYLQNRNPAEYREGLYNILSSELALVTASGVSFKDSRLVTRFFNDKQSAAELDQAAWEILKYLMERDIGISIEITRPFQGFFTVSERDGSNYCEQIRLME